MMVAFLPSPGPGATPGRTPHPNSGGRAQPSQGPARLLSPWWPLPLVTPMTSVVSHPQTPGSQGPAALVPLPATVPGSPGWPWRKQVWRAVGDSADHLAARLPPPAAARPRRLRLPRCLETSSSAFRQLTAAPREPSPIPQWRGLEGLPRTPNARSRRGLHSFLLADPGPRHPGEPLAPCRAGRRTSGPDARPTLGAGASRGPSRFFEHGCSPWAPGCTRLSCQRRRLLVAVGLLGR